jgi:hypothetical protein
MTRGTRARSGTLMRLVSTDLWHKITALAGRKGPRFVAVAYLSTGARTLLPMDDGDVLVVDLSDRAVTTGLTNPHEVLWYLGKGVRVFTKANLHAKVFVLGNTVVVGSADVSRNSRDSLVEAAVISSDDAIRASTTKWIRSLAVAPVSPGLAKRKLKLYKPPIWERDRSRQPDVSFRVWLAYSHSYDFTPGELKVLAAQERQAAKHIVKPRAFKVAPIIWEYECRLTRTVQPEDVVIVIQWEDRQGRRVSVYPPARVLSIKRYRAPSGPRIAVHLERARHDEGIAFGPFVRAAKRVGISVQRDSEFEVRTTRAREALLLHLSP